MVRVTQRPADYFIIVGRSTRQQDHLSSSALHFQPGVLQRYPSQDHQDTEFPKDCPIFAFPYGVNVVEVTGDKPPEHHVHHFTLTEEDGARVFATALIFYEYLDDEEAARFTVILDVVDEQEEEAKINDQPRRLVIPYAIIVTSHWPFYNCFERFLRDLYQRTIPENSDYAKADIPIERSIVNLIMETPLPPRGRIEVRMYLELTKNQSILFSRPPPNKLPLFSLDFERMFRYLSLDNIMIIFSAMLTERRIMFISDHLQKLTEVIETLSFLIFPMVWRHIYIPVLPKKLIDFVCAPMPFMVGIHKSYVPDELMLEGVIVVDIDKDSIMADLDPNEPLHSLPEKSGSKLYRGLKKHLQNLGDDQSLDQAAICELFSQFFVGILQDYHRYMEAPSEFVVDKFDKAKFLEEHAEYCAFFDQYLDSQMFQCFVDDRYEAKPNDLEALYFDECIERFKKGSKANLPFLEDTSNLHKTVTEAVLPYVEDLDGPIYYEGWPQELDESFFEPVRPVEPLFDLKEDIEGMKRLGGVNNVAMRYFADKNLYARQFHSLQIRSNKQDLIFRQIIEFMRAHQAYIDGNLRHIRQLNNSSRINLVETNTSVDIGWSGLLRHMEEQTRIFSTTSRTLRADFFLNTYTEASEIEANLQVLFTEVEALNISSSTWKTKVDVLGKEYAKSKANLKKFESEPDSLLLTRPNTIQERIRLEHRLHEAFLFKVEAESQFRKVYRVYEKRMPQIVEEVRRLNGQRISAFKGSMKAYVESQVQFINDISRSVSQLEEMVEQVDVEKDVGTFSEGKLGFLALESKEHEKTDEDSTVSPTGSVADFEDAKEENEDPGSPYMKGLSFRAQADRSRLSIMDETMRDPNRYSLRLFGMQGFTLAISQATKAKKLVKETFLSLEEYATISDQYGKQCQKLHKQLASYKPQIGSTQINLWEVLLNMIHNEYKWYTLKGDRMRDFAGYLRVLKGVTKSMYNAMEEHRSGLDVQVRECQDKVDESRDNLEKLEKQFKQMESMQDGMVDDPRKSLERIEKARRKFKQAENDFRLSKLFLSQMEEMRDVSLGRMLDMLQEKELQKCKELRQILLKIVAILSNLWNVNKLKDLEVLEYKIDELDTEHDLREFVFSTYTAVTQENVKLGEEEEVDFANHLSDIRASSSIRIQTFNAMSKYGQKGATYVKHLIIWTEERCSFLENMAKTLKKSESVLTLNSGSADSLSRALAAWNELNTSMVENITQHVDRIRETTINDLEQLRNDIKTSLATLAKNFQKLRKEIEPVQKVHQQWVQKCTQAKGNLEKMNQKLAQLQNSPEKKKNKLLQRIQNNTEKQQQKVQVAQEELKEARHDLETTTLLLQKHKEMEIQKFSKICKHFKDLETKRYDRVYEIMAGFTNASREFCGLMQGLIEALHSRADSVDFTSDIHEFISKNQTMIAVPDHVREEISRQQEEENDEKLELDLIFKRDSMLAVASFSDVLLDVGGSMSEEELKYGDPFGETQAYTIELLQPSDTEMFFEESAQWQEYWDEDSQNPFYVHVETGEAQWEPPDSPYIPYKEI